MKPIRILIVEEMDNVREMYDKFLPNEVFEKHFAADGKQGLNMYQTCKPEILLLDISLPVISGIELLKIIRTDLGDKQTAIIMQTSHSDKNEIVECAKHGIQGYFIKFLDALESGVKILECFSCINKQRAAQALEIMNYMEKTPSEHEYLEELRYCLQEGGITDSQRRLLDRLREKLSISKARARDLENGLIHVINPPAGSCK